MASSMDKLAKELKAQMTASDDRKPKPYDTQAEVLRVEDDIAWVHIPGGVSETPVKLTINAKKGDSVNVHVANGTAWITGNATNPPTDDTTANDAAQNAVYAVEIGTQALDDSQRALLAANSAEVDAARANIAANRADQAAGIANTAANTAITQLGIVEDVVGVLNWISEHASYAASADTEVIAGKMYFSRSGDTYTPIANPTGDPSVQGYYEIDNIDEAVSNYVSSHLALTDAGLWVVNDNQSYKILLASDGMKVYDAAGNLVSSFGESIEFSSSKAQYIGGENAYIIFDPSDGSMLLGGSQLNISGNVHFDSQARSLSQILADMQSEIDGSIETWYYSGVPTTLNEPAVNWQTASQKAQHLRDLYFDTSTGHTYRWAFDEDDNEFSWIEIADTDATAALRMAEEAIKTVEYAPGNSPTTPPSTGWSTASPTWSPGTYIWMRQSKDGTNYTYTCIQGAKGEDGEDAVNISIISTEGTVFKSNNASTRLDVYIYHRGEITTKQALEQHFGVGTYLQWQVRKYGDPSPITIPTTYEGLSNDGFSLTVGADDVNRWTVYTVQIITS